MGDTHVGFYTHTCSPIHFNSLLLPFSPFLSFFVPFFCNLGFSFSFPTRTCADETHERVCALGIKECSLRTGDEKRRVGERKRLRVWCPEYNSRWGGERGREKEDRRERIQLVPFLMRGRPLACVGVFMRGKRRWKRKRCRQRGESKKETQSEY